MYYKQSKAVSVKSLTKSYKIFDTVNDRLFYYIFHKNKGREYLALKNITFDIYKGETFGIIGKNGSGKSTLLQIIAGILKPSSGAVDINGKVAALLELGSGFNPENTGYENIFMNAAVLGIGKNEIEQKMDDIVQFADIGDFLYQPVKTYSSGMYIRLAFAVAINVDADIILIDEALAVGDIFFRQKCYTRLNELKSMGKTIILVTHSMGEVEQFCDRAVLLSNGQQHLIGNSADVVKHYYLLEQEVTNENNLKNTLTVGTQKFISNPEFFNSWTFFDKLTMSLECQITNGKANIAYAGLYDKDGYSKNIFEQGEWAYFYFEFVINKPILVPIVGILLKNDKNIIVHGKNSMQTYLDVPKTVAKDTMLQVVHAVQLSLEQGEYTYEVGLTEMDDDIYKIRDKITNEELFGVEKRIVHCSKIGMFSVIEKKVGTPTRLTHHGICDLKTKIGFQISIRE